MTGRREISIHEVARRADRDIKAVHGDVTVLLEAGILDRPPTGIAFPLRCYACRFHADEGDLGKPEQAILRTALRHGAKSAMYRSGSLSERRTQ